MTGTLNHSDISNQDNLVAIEINGVTAIGNEAFATGSEYTSMLTSVTIGNTITAIGDSAFNDCGALTEITIPGNVTSIGTTAFNYCSNLTSVTIENGVTTIGEGAFGSTGLTSLTLPSSVISIPNPHEGSGEGIGYRINDLTFTGRSISDVLNWLNITLEDSDAPDYGTLHCTDGTLTYYEGYTAEYNP